MKAVWLACLVAASASGQTFCNFVVMPTNHSAGMYRGTNSFAVPSNSTAQVVGMLSPGSGNVFLYCEVEPAGLPRSEVGSLAAQAGWFDVSKSPKFVGPCRVYLRAASETNSGYGLYSVRFDSFNVGALPGGVIQPAGFAAVVRLETSTNLATWATLTNASFPKIEANRFFRLSLELP